MSSSSVVPIAQTPQQVAANYGISTGTLANWRTQKKGPKFFKVGSGKILYKTSDIEAFLFSHPVMTKDSLER